MYYEDTSLQLCQPHGLALTVLFYIVVHCINVFLPVGLSRDAMSYAMMLYYLVYFAFLSCDFLNYHIVYKGVIKNALHP